jgi:hypothetical protein
MRVSSAAAATSLPVTFESPCECRDNHGEHHWVVKNDPSTPPVEACAIQAVTPSDVFSWPGLAEHLTQSSERTGIENNWFALTGRVVAVKVEMDGDLHLALQDVTGDKAGIVVCEIPAKQQWCSIRETVFSWTTTRFPFHTSSDRKLKLIQAPIITVTGKAYWDVGHAPKDQSNRRSHLPGYAAWEIHPSDEAGHSLKSLRLHVYGATAQRYESKISANNQRPEISSQRLCGPA